MLGFLLVLPTAAASIDQDTPVARVEVTQFGDSACAHETGPCLVAARNTTAPADSEVDLRLNVEYVGIGTHLDAARGLGAPIHDQDLAFDTRDVAVHHPVFTTLDELGPVVNAHDPVIDYFGLFYDRSDDPHPGWVAGVYWYGPSSYDPSLHRNYYYLMTGGDEGWWQHDQIGLPFTHPSAETTDMEYEFVPIATCETAFTPPACWDAMNGTEGPYHETVPNVRLSFTYDATQVATNASDLSPPRAPAGPAVGRAVPLDPVSLAPAAPSPVDAAPRDASGGGTAPAAHDPATARARGTDPERVVPRSVSSPSPPQHVPPSALLLIVVTAAGATCFVLLAFGLYSRITSARAALASPARDRIHDIIRASPGIHEAELTARSGLSRGSVRNHVAVLARLGLVRVERGAARAALYSSGVRAAAPPDVVLFGHRARIIASLGCVETGLSMAALCRTIPDVPRSTLVHGVARLVEMGQVRRAGAQFVLAQ